MERAAGAALGCGAGGDGGLTNPAPRVLLLHGFAGLPGVMHPLAWSLRRAGYRALAPWYDSWRLPLPAIVDRMDARLAALAAEAPDAPLHLVGHSMGGLVARALIERRRPENLGRVVMLGTPNGGSELADTLHGWPATRMVLGRAAPALLTARDAALDGMLGTVGYPLGVIAGDRPMMRGFSDRILPAPHDGKVSVTATHVAGEADHLVLPLSHMMLAYDARAHAQVARFLAQGSFQRGKD